VLKIDSVQGVIYFELKINRKDLLSSSETGKNSAGIRL
jgi:hypothetical protein